MTNMRSDPSPKCPLRNFSLSSPFAPTEPEAHSASVAADCRNWVSALAACRYSDLIASGAADGFVRLWQAEAPRSLRPVPPEISIYRLISSSLHHLFVPAPPLLPSTTSSSLHHLFFPSPPLLLPFTTISSLHLFFFPSPPLLPSTSSPLPSLLLESTEMCALMHSWVTRIGALRGPALRCVHTKHSRKADPFSVALD